MEKQCRFLGTVRCMFLNGQKGKKFTYFLCLSEGSCKDQETRLFSSKVCLRHIKEEYLNKSKNQVLL